MTKVTTTSAISAAFKAPTFKFSGGEPSEGTASARKLEERTVAAQEKREKEQERTKGDKQPAERPNKRESQ